MNRFDEACIGYDCIFKDAKCFILAEWFDGTFQSGDQFKFTADPSCTTLEVPVLFYQEDAQDPNSAVAYTINHVNCIVDGTTVFTGLPWELATWDTIEDYVDAMFEAAGYTTIEMPSSVYYQARWGNIHCGTNAFRAIPSYDWWKY